VPIKFKHFRTRLIPVLALFAGPFCIAQDRPAVSVELLLKKAKISIAENELERAESELRQLLGVVLEDLGDSYSVLGDNELALKAYREASQASIINDRPLLALTRFCIRNGYYDLGKDAVEKLLAINPIHPIGRYLLGNLQILTGEFEQASHVLKDAYLAAPENSDIGLALAYSYLVRKDLKNGLPLIEKLYSGDSSSPEMSLVIGRILLETGHFSKAVEYLESARNSGLNSAGKYLERAVAESIPDFSEEPSVLVGQPAATKPPPPATIEAARRTAAFAYAKLGELEMRKQRFPWAEDHISKAVWWDESLPGIQVLQAWVRYQSGDLMEAIDPIKTGLRQQPRNPDALQLLTRITIDLIDNQRLREAEECAGFLLSLEPETAYFYVLRGRIKAEEGDFQAALKDFARALELNPGIPEAHYNSGVLKLKDGNIEAAVQEFDLELQISPDHEMALFRKAEALNQLGRTGESKSLLLQVVEINPELIPAYRMLAALQISQGNLTAAIANLETAFRKDPENPNVLLELEKAYTRAGRTRDAAATRAKYERLKNR